MIENKLQAISPRDQSLIVEGKRVVYQQAKSIVLKIDISKRVSSFDETFFLAVLKALKIDFKLETCEVPTFRGCSAE